MSCYNPKESQTEAVKFRINLQSQILREPTSWNNDNIWSDVNIGMGVNNMGSDMDYRRCYEKHRLCYTDWVTQIGSHRLGYIDWVAQIE